MENWYYMNCNVSFSKIRGFRPVIDLRQNIFFIRKHNVFIMLNYFKFNSAIFWCNFNFNFEYNLKNILYMLVSVISIFTLFSFSLYFHRPFFSSTFLSIGLFFIGCFFLRPFSPSAVFSLGFFFLGLFFPAIFS